MKKDKDDDKPKRQLDPIDPWADFDHIFDHFFAPLRSFSELKSGLISPLVDIIEDDHCFTIKANLPGVEKKHIQIEIDKGTVTIEADINKEDGITEGEYIRRERKTGKYLRKFHLGDNLRHEETHAQFKDGVLALHIPKSRYENISPTKISID